MFSIKLSLERKNIPYVLLTFSVFYNVIVYFIQFFTSRINIGIKNLSSIVYFTVFFLLLFIASSEIINKLKKKKAWEVPVLFTCFAVSYCTTYIFKENTINAIKDGSSIFYVLFFLLSVYSCARVVDDYDKIFRYNLRSGQFSRQWSHLNSKS